MRSSDFDDLVEQAYRRIPARFRRRLKNVVIVVEDEPVTDQLAAGRVPRGHTLLGLYEGRPLTHRSSFDSFTMPDRITIFQGPIERMAHSREHLAEIIEQTLWHEIAHYFGMDEKQVRAAERRRYSAAARLQARERR